MQFKVPREEWPKGEWDNEPDFYELEHKGVDCKITRSTSGTWWVFAYFRYSKWLEKEIKSVLSLTWVKVHGGVTFKRICVDTDTGKNLVIMVGFDCDHGGDKPPFDPIRCLNHPLKCKCGGPGVERIKKRREEIPDIYSRFEKLNTYRNMEFVIKECKSMVDQLLKKEKNDGT